MIAGASEGWSWKHSDLYGLLESWVGSVERATETQSDLRRIKYNSVRPDAHERSIFPSIQWENWRAGIIIAATIRDTAA
jgi:hypothetical protein